MKAKVTVICLCYNQALYVEDAVSSVYSQEYDNIELILVDDGSTDNSAQVIFSIQEKFPDFLFIDHKENKGMCSSFNEALAIASGEYIIDLAADDILLPARISEQVKAFESLNQNYGIVFSDAYLINEKKEITGTFYKRNNLEQLVSAVPEGYVFKELVHSYKICSPTIMVRRSVLIELGGYDESLSYEDYDFFVRSSRNYKFHFVNKPLIYKRELKSSLAMGFYKKDQNPHLSSTLVVCKKALWLCRNEEEKKALLHSVRYHFRQSYFLGLYTLAGEYYKLIQAIGKDSVVDKMIFTLVKNKVNVYKWYMFYLKIRNSYK
jgi:glycosyltransferase involved in cell wall biosynthesis